MAITTWGGKQTIDPPMPSTEENVRVVVKQRKVMEKMQKYL